MPSSFLTMDSEFPTFRDGESLQQQVQMLYDYLYKLQEGLRYSLRNLKQIATDVASLKEQNGSNGIASQLKDIEESVEKILAVISPDENGDVTIGSQGNALKLVGELYINDILYEEGGST